MMMKAAVSGANMMKASCAEALLVSVRRAGPQSTITYINNTNRTKVKITYTDDDGF
jgi:hypothetical protein